MSNLLPSDNQYNPFLRPYIQHNRAEYQQVNNGTDNNSKTNTRTHARGKIFFNKRTIGG